MKSSLSVFLLAATGASAWGVGRPAPPLSQLKPGLRLAALAPTPPQAWRGHLVGSGTLATARGRLALKGAELQLRPQGTFTLRYQSASGVVAFGLVEGRWHTAKGTALQVERWNGETTVGQGWISWKLVGNDKTPARLHLEGQPKATGAWKLDLQVKLAQPKPLESIVKPFPTPRPTPTATPIPAPTPFPFIEPAPAPPETAPVAPLYLPFGDHTITSFLDVRDGLGTCVTDNGQWQVTTVRVDLRADGAGRLYLTGTGSRLLDVDWQQIDADTLELRVRGDEAGTIRLELWNNQLAHLRSLDGLQVEFAAGVTPPPEVPAEPSPPETPLPFDGGWPSNPAPLPDPWYFPPYEGNPYPYPPYRPGGDWHDHDHNHDHNHDHDHDDDPPKHPRPTPTPRPTGTPGPAPTATPAPTPRPTRTPRPTPVPSATPVPQATPTPDSDDEPGKTLGGRRRLKKGGRVFKGND